MAKKNQNILLIVGVVAVLIIMNQQGQFLGSTTGGPNYLLTHEIQGMRFDESAYQPTGSGSANIRVLPFSITRNTSRWVWNYTEGISQYKVGEYQTNPLGTFVVATYRLSEFTSPIVEIDYDNGLSKSIYLPDMAPQNQETRLIFYVADDGSTYWDFELTVLAKQAPQSNCNGVADTDCDGQVSRTELGNAITAWLAGTITRSDVSQAIQAWSTA